MQKGPPPGGPSPCWSEPDARQDGAGRSGNDYCPAGLFAAGGLVGAVVWPAAGGVAGGVAGAVVVVLAGGVVVPVVSFF